MLVPLSVADCMTREVETTTPDATVRDAARALAAAQVGSLVVHEAGAAVGILTESDLVGLLAEGAAVDALAVADAMTPDPTTVEPEASLERAAELLTAGGFRRLPVVDDGDLVGIVTTTDLSDYLPRLAARRRHADAAVGPDGRLAPSNPEMAYDLPEWEFEGVDDADGLTAGDVVRFRKELSDADVRAFAEASGDTNRLHLDEGFAAGTRFGGRIVHGALAAGLISAALARLPGLVIYLSQDLRFLGPVGVGEVATAVFRVCEDLDGAKYRLDVAVHDADGDRAVDGSAVVLVDELPGDVESPASPTA
ncbi:MAG: CBS domain-containing protein [Haloferacaceae archaeon]